MDAWSNGMRDEDKKLTAPWLDDHRSDWVDDDLGKEDRPEWHRDAANATRAVVVAGLRMPEDEDRGLDLTNDCYNGQDGNTHKNGRVVRVIPDTAD